MLFLCAGSGMGSRLCFRQCWYHSPVVALLAKVVTVLQDGCLVIKLGWKFIQKLLRDWLGISLLVVSDCFSIPCALCFVVDGAVGFFLIYYTVFTLTLEFSLSFLILWLLPGRGKWASSCGGVQLPSRDNPPHTDCWVQNGIQSPHHALL